jgi:transcriptional regulator with XRE-family HTH domain
MGSEYSPAIPRRELLLALRKLRELRQMTAQEAALQLDWPTSKLLDIERGDTPVRIDELLALLKVYRLSDPETVDQLVELADNALREGWWSEADFREHLTEAMLDLKRFECQAEGICVFQPSLVPGFLQNRGYAGAVLGTWRECELGNRTRALRLENRMRRKENLFGDADAPRVRVVLGETVLLQQPGGVAVMASQLAHLLDMWHAQPNLFIRVVRHADVGWAAGLGPFTLLDLGLDRHLALYLEQHLSDEFVVAPDRTDAYQERFQKLWDAALSEKDSRDLVRRRAQELGSKVIRRVR